MAPAFTRSAKARRLSSVRVAAPHSELSKSLISLNAIRVSLIEQTTGNLHIEADQIGGIEAEVLEPLSLEIINRNQVRQPVDALEDDPRGPGGQERRRCLRGRHASPDEDLRDV
jgi:hypothetical protein